MNNGRGADPALVTRLQAVLHEGPPLGLAILFGSASAGLTRRDSDVDIAILSSARMLDDATERSLNRQLALAARAEVDLVRIEHASTLLKWRIATTGMPLLEASPGEFARFRARAASEYIDYAPLFARHAEVFRRRLIEQGRRS